MRLGGRRCGVAWAGGGAALHGVHLRVLAKWALGLAELSAECFGWIRELVRLLWHGNCLQFMLNTAPYIMLTVPEHYKIISPFSLKTISNSRVIV